MTPSLPRSARLARLAPGAALVLAVVAAGGVASAATTPTPSPSASAAPANAGALTTDAQLTGSGPVTAWFGGAAERTYVLTVRNGGATPVRDPAVLLTVGKEAEPTKELARPTLGTIAPGQTVQYRLPVTLQAPAFGQYRVQATFTDVSEPIVTTATTSSYPWALFVLGWLLLQPLLLGLYKRRPGVDHDDADPFEAAAPAPAPVLVGAPAQEGIHDVTQDPAAYDPNVYDPNAYDPNVYDPNAAPPPYLPPYEPEPAYAQPQEALYFPPQDPAFAAPQPEPVAQYPAPYEPAPAAFAAPAAAPPVAAPPVGAPAAVVPHTPSALVPNYRPVFGVTDLRTYLDPQGVEPPPAPVTPRVVVGGVVPTAAPQPPDAPH